MLYLSFNILCLKLPSNREGFNLRGHCCSTYGRARVYSLYTNHSHMGSSASLGAFWKCLWLETYGEDFGNLPRTLDFTMTDIESYLRVGSLLD